MSLQSLPIAGEIGTGSPTIESLARDPIELRRPPRTAGSQPTLHEAVQALLHKALGHIDAGDGLVAFRLLTSPLSALWSQARATDQERDMQHWCRQHPLHALVRQDPFTARAAERPRGYAGDAVMMDFIYAGEPPEGTSALGRAVFSGTTRTGMGLSVCYRRALLRGLIDETAGHTPCARMLSVACGHARELEGSLVAAPFFDGEFVALDQDALSCAEVEHANAHAIAGGRLRVVNRGVRELMAKSAEAQAQTDALGRFDLIYSAGLYDYLPDVAARRLTRQLLAMLRPGGRLLVANFVPTGAGRGYMELFMDWTLVLRNEAQMQEMALAAGAAQVSSFHDPHRNVVYVELANEPAR